MQCPRCGIVSFDAEGKCACGFELSAPEGEAEQVPPEQVKVLKRISVFNVVMLALISGGVYIPLWFLRRSRELDRLKMGRINEATCNLAVIIWAFTIIFGVAIGTSQTFSIFLGMKLFATLLNLVCGLFILSLSFRARAIIQEAFSVRLSGLATFFFHSFYLQYRINRLAGGSQESTAAASEDGGHLREVAFDRALTRWPVITSVLVLLNVSLLVLAEVAGGSANPLVLRRFGAQINSMVLDGEYWRIMSMVFLHIGVLHLVGNSLALLYLGRTCENIYGRAQFLFLYICAGLAGSVATLLFHEPYMTSVGASGAIFGLMGAQIAFGLKHRGAIPRRFQRNFGLASLAWGVFMILEGFRVPNVNNAAHIGGLLGGLACALVLHPVVLSPQIAARRTRAAARAITGAVALGVLLITAGLAVQYAQREGYRELELKKGSLWFNPTVSEAEAKKLGQHLAAQGFFDAGSRVALFSKTGAAPLQKGTYIFEVMVGENTVHNIDYRVTFQLLALDLRRGVLGGPVQVHLLNQKLEVIGVIGDAATLESGNVKLYHSDAVKGPDAKKLMRYLAGEAFFRGGTGTFHLDRPRSRYELRMSARPDLELSGETMQHFSLLGLLLSEDVFGKAPLDIVLCDHHLRDLKLIKMAPRAGGYQQLLEAMRAAIKEEAPGR